MAQQSASSSSTVDTSMSKSPYLAFLESPHQLEVIDQRKLPQAEVKVRLRTVEDVKKAIELMIVRGAPLIGICGAFGMALAREYNEDLDAMKRQLDSARPTAVNLMHATSRMVAFARKSKENRANMFDEVKQIANEEFAACEKMAEYGARLIPTQPREGQTTVNVIHHCNTGGLATYGAGTALGCITKRAKLSPNLFVWVDETRPRLQGAKLTSWELNRAKIPNKVIADGAAGLVLQTNRADCVLFGADRITANGDVVNKIGTYPLAVVARENGAPVYCVAPTSSIDLTIPNGNAVTIEERGDDELLEFEGKRFVDANTKGFNPAFDVTPFRYLTAIVTEEGVCYPPFRESLAGAKARALAKQQGISLHAGGSNVVVESGNLVAVAAVAPDAVDTITQILDRTSIKKSSNTAERLFAGQNEPVDAKPMYHREDRRAVKPKTYLGDGSDEPKIEQVRDHSRPAVKSFLGDGSNADQAITAPSNVRVFNEIKKSSLVLSDEASGEPAQPDAKASIRVTQKAKTVPLFADEDEAALEASRKAKKPAPITSTIPTDEDIDVPVAKPSMVAKGHIQPPTHQPLSPEPTIRGHLDAPAPPQEPAPTAKGHVEPPKRSETDRPTSKGHLIPPSPERPPVPQTKGHINPAPITDSNIFG